MAINFPSAPSVGQIHTSGGASFIWDGVKWKTVATNVPNYAHGGVQIYRVDDNNLGVRPYNGGRLLIGGESRVVAAATKAVASATVDATTYVYAFLNGSVVDYEFSTTGHVLGADGVEVKSGDPSRTLIGMFLRSSSFGFKDEKKYRFVNNWFAASRRPKLLQTNINAAIASATTQTPLETAYATLWGGTEFSPVLSGLVLSSGGASGIMIGGIFFNGASTGVEGHAHAWAQNIYSTVSCVGDCVVGAADQTITIQPTSRAAGIASFTITANLVATIPM